MTSKVTRSRNHDAGAADEIERLYLELLHSFYEEEDRERAHKVADRLEAALAAQPEFVGSIRVEEIHSLIAELRGDLAEAVRRRESEIERIRQLHGLAVNTPGRDFVFRQYDYSDLSDRLDILATLYAEQSNFDRAVEVLRESREVCESHQVPFDGRELLDEYEQIRHNRSGEEISPPG